MRHSLPLLLTLPWVLTPVVTLVRARHSTSLDDHSADVPRDAELLSVVIPARNEARNIERCVRSVLASTWAPLEVIAVDDHSDDATGDILARIAGEDSRLSVLMPEPLSAGWFGKQWACTAGYRRSSGSVVAFFDADTWQTPDLLVRAMNAMRARNADMLSVAGTQEMESFWEKLVQPQIFGTMLQRFGGTESVNRSSRIEDKIANGQCIFFRRSTYDAIGGHGAVREKVAEDLALAQLFFARGRTVVLLLGLSQLHTRMYTSLSELIGGWGKNMYAGGRDSMPLGKFGQWVYPYLMLTPGVFGLMPFVLFVLALLHVLGSGVLLWSSIVMGVSLLWWAAVYLWLGMSPAWSLLHPLGAATQLYIGLGSVLRGRNVRWKDRHYVVD